MRAWLSSWQRRKSGDARLSGTLQEPGGAHRVVLSFAVDPAQAPQHDHISVYSGVGLVGRVLKPEVVSGHLDQGPQLSSEAIRRLWFGG